VLIALAMLPWVLPSASGAVTQGATVALVGPEQTIRDNSSAIPLFGFSMTSDAGDALDNVSVAFAGTTFYSGNNATLYTLDPQATISGVGLYRDDGTTDDVLDARDSPVTVDGAFWSSNIARLVLTSHNEPLPTSTNGQYHWFVVMRTAANGAWLIDTGNVVAQIGTGGIVATDGAGLSAQPASSVTTNTMFVRHTRAFSLMNSTNNYIGQGSVAVHERAPFGLRIVDGSADPATGIDDWMTSFDLRLNQVSGFVNSYDFAPITTDAATSGIAVYIDDGDLEDILDINDTGIDLGSISPTVFPAGGQNFHLTFSPPVEIPDDTTGLVSFLIVVRTGYIVTGDAFQMRLVLGTTHTSGVLPGDADRVTNSATNASVAQINGDNTPPVLNSLQWNQQLGPFVTAVGSELWFNHQMPVPTTAWATALVYDSQSGMGRIEWSPESGVAAGPAPTVSGWWPPTTSLQSAMASFDFDASSVDSSSPADVTIYDAVGNMAMASVSGQTLSYVHEEAQISIDPDSGFTGTDYDGVHLDANGTLWFSDRVYYWSASYGYFQATVTSLYGGGIESIWITPAPNFGSVSPAQTNYSPGTAQVSFSGTVSVLSNSTQGNGSIVLNARDYSGATASASFPVREDNVGPTVTLSGLTNGQVVSGMVRLHATIADSGSGVYYAWLEALPDYWDWTMYRSSDTEWVVDIDTTHLSDGPTRLTAFGRDHVGNEGSATVEVVVDNTDMDEAAPLVALVSPEGGAFLAGSATVQVSAQDAGGVASAWMRVGQGPWVQLTFNSGTGFFEGTWDTTSASDGTHEITVMARDGWLNEASTDPVSVTVDNHNPMVSITGPAPEQTLAGTYSVRVFASDEIGVASVTVTVGGRTVDVAYNPSTGYYEYTLDTRTMADGEYSVVATAEDASGKTVTASSVGFRVKNTPDSDLWRSLRESANFLFLLFVVLAFVVVLMLAKRGTLSQWMKGDGGHGGGGGGGAGGGGSAGADRSLMAGGTSMVGSGGADSKEPPK
jgi:hypothetical protein